MSLYSRIAIAAAVVLAIGWLVVSFQAPGRRRSIVEWISALALYLMLCVLMAHQLQHFLDARRWWMVGTFGFLCFLFGSGFLVTAVLLVRELRGEKDGGTDATH